MDDGNTIDPVMRGHWSDTDVQGVGPNHPHAVHLPQQHDPARIGAGRGGRTGVPKAVGRYVTGEGCGTGISGRALPEAMSMPCCRSGQQGGSERSLGAFKVRITGTKAILYLAAAGEA
jgi:hypothetical protein